MSKETESSFLIASSLPALYQHLLSGVANYQELGNRILHRIKAAHAFRRVEQVRELARILTNIPIKEYQLIGQYYLVWCKCRELEYHPDILERIVEQTRTYKAKALISRAALDVYQGNIERAFYFYGEALTANPTISDLIKASTGIATLKTIEGFNASALKELEKLIALPLRYAEPLTYFELINSYAVTLIDNNRLSEAENVSLLAVSSPFGRFYPELQETLLEARSRRKKRSPVSISLPQEQEHEPTTREPVNNIIQFPIDETVPEPRVQIAINFMNVNLQRRVSLSELAAVVNLSPAYFSYLFKTETGVAPSEYLIRLRMEKASQLLATSLLRIKEIMAMVGYNNKSNFCRQFKRYFDLNASAYRKRAFARHLPLKF